MNATFNVVVDVGADQLRPARHTNIGVETTAIRRDWGRTTDVGKCEGVVNDNVHGGVQVQVNVKVNVI